MKPVKIMAVLLVVSSLNVFGDDSVSSDNPYATVVSRNLFGLVPMPPPKAEDHSDPKDPPLKITPNGIMRLFGHLQVLFKVAVPPKPGQPGHEQSYIMSEGERQDEIEVTKIDEKSGMITFNNHGEIQELPLANAPEISTPASPPTPNNAHLPPGVHPALPGAPRANPANPAWQRRLGQNQNRANQPASNPRTYNPGAMANMSHGSISPEAQALIIEAEREHLKQEKNPPYPPSILPPTPLTPKLQDESGK